jgi:hypothetical protein
MPVQMVGRPVALNTSVSGLMSWLAILRPNDLAKACKFAYNWAVRQGCHMVPFVLHKRGLACLPASENIPRLSGLPCRSSNNLFGHVKPEGAIPQSLRDDKVSDFYEI